MLLVRCILRLLPTCFALCKTTFYRILNVGFRLYFDNIFRCIWCGEEVLLLLFQSTTRVLVLSSEACFSACPSNAKFAYFCCIGFLFLQEPNVHYRELKLYLVLISFEILVMMYCLKQCWQLLFVWERIRVIMLRLASQQLQSVAFTRKVINRELSDWYWASSISRVKSLYTSRVFWGPTQDSKRSLRMS